MTPPVPPEPSRGDAPAPIGQPAGHRDRLPTWRLVAAIVLPVCVIVAVVVAAAVINSRPATDVSDPLPVSAVDAPGAGTAACAGLLAALPDPLGQLPRRTLDHADDPSLAGVAGWGEPAVVLRCGVPTPTELTCSAAVQVVDGVTWLPLYGSGVITYLAVDRSVRVALTVPDGTSTGPWQEMSTIIGATLPVRPVCVDGEPVPPEAG